MQTLIRVASKTDVQRDGLVAIEAFGEKIVLCHIADHFYAVGAFCPHQKRPLTPKGCMTARGTLVCPWHFAEFDPATGACVKPPATCVELAHLPIFPLLEDGDDLFLAGGAGIAA